MKIVPNKMLVIVLANTFFKTKKKPEYLPLTKRGVAIIAVNLEGSSVGKVSHCGSATRCQTSASDTGAKAGSHTRFMILLLCGLPAAPALTGEMAV